VTEEVEDVSVLLMWLLTSGRAALSSPILIRACELK
jgi:hypothetical protein